jgi:hypothetical protein
VGHPVADPDADVYLSAHAAAEPHAHADVHVPAHAAPDPDADLHLPAHATAAASAVQPDSHPEHVAGGLAVTVPHPDRHGHGLGGSVRWRQHRWWREHRRWRQ